MTTPLLVQPAERYANGFVIPWHHHDADQLITATAGVMTVETDDGVWVVPPERGVWVPAGTNHRITMSGSVALQGVYLEPELASLDEDVCRVVQISALLRAAVDRAAEFEYPYPREGAEAHVEAVLVDELTAADVAPLHLPMPSDPLARSVATAFLADPADRRTRGVWARDAGISERTLERLFHEEVDTTFGRWQRQARLLLALRLLADGHDVTRTALDVGFDTPSAFIAMFRRATGTTPGRYFDSDSTVRRQDR